MDQSRRSIARSVIVAFLAAAGLGCWEIGADAGRIRVAARVLGGQTVSLGSASASDSYVLAASLAVCVALAVAVVAFVAWLRRSGRNGPSMPTVLAVWWLLWLLANIVGRLVELTYRSTSSLADIRNLALLDLGDCVVLIASLLAMVLVIRRRQARVPVRRPVPAAARKSTAKRAETPTIADPVPEAEPPTADRRRTATIAVSAGALVVAPLILAFAVSNGTTRVARPSATPAPQSAAWQASNAAATTCSDAMFQPGGAISAGANSTCADLTLGASLFSADCTKGKVPATLSPEIFDNTGQSSDLGTVRAAAAGCDLTTTSTSVTAAVLAGDSDGPTNEPGSVVVVADFIPADNPAGLNTVGVRVSATSELDVAVESNGGYAVIESINGATPEALLQGSFSSGQAGAPNLAKAIRVVVYVKGSTAAAYVDGLRLGTGPTSVPNAPGGCGFSLSTNDSSKPVVATLLHLEIFATT